jgi:hypothetical protein
MFVIKIETCFRCDGRLNRVTTRVTPASGIQKLNCRMRKKSRRDFCKSRSHRMLNPLLTAYGLQIRKNGGKAVARLS